MYLPIKKRKTVSAKIPPQIPNVFQKAIGKSFELCLKATNREKRPQNFANPDRNKKLYISQMKNMSGQLNKTNYHFELTSYRMKDNPDLPLRSPQGPFMPVSGSETYAMALGSRCGKTGQSTKVDGRVTC